MAENTCLDAPQILLPQQPESNEDVELAEQPSHTDSDEEPDSSRGGAASSLQPRLSVRVPRLSRISSASEKRQNPSGRRFSALSDAFSRNFQGGRLSPRRLSAVSRGSRRSSGSAESFAASLASRLSPRRPSRVSIGSVQTDGSVMQRVTKRMSALHGTLEEEDSEMPEQVDSSSSSSCSCSLAGCSLAAAIRTSIAVPTVACGLTWLIFEISEDVQLARALVAILLSCVLVFGLTASVFLPLEMNKLLNFVTTLTDVMTDATVSSGELHPLLQKTLAQSSKISEIAAVERSCHSLALTTAMFMRFVPDTLVRGILRGDDRSMRLHVNRRVVTIMFADIANFTTIAEQLKQEDLLFLLTRYLSVITQIIESHEGVVAEIMGDGLLAFWNTPDDVFQPEAKACASALAQQHAMKMLNEELATLMLRTTLAVRIGINTGRVLTGNLGSDKKMKFGCLGDPMNLASRLEGLCKMYGTSVICSGKTFDALPEDYGFLCRELDLVQVKGKSEATRIYEIISCGRTATEHSTAASANDFLQKAALSSEAWSPCRVEPLSPPSEAGGETSPKLLRQISPASNTPTEVSEATLRSRVKQYQTALKAFQRGNFKACCEVLTALLEETPDDKACQLLLERARGAAKLSAPELNEWTSVNVLFEK